MTRGPRSIERLAAASLCLLAYLVGLVCAIVALEASHVAPNTVLLVAKGSYGLAFALVVMGWKWPLPVLRPFALAWRRASTRADGHANHASRSGFSAPSAQSGKGSRWLASTAERALLVAGCIGLSPWLLFRAVRELWRSAGSADYLHNVVAAPITPWFEAGWWWYTRLNWYDWPVLPSLAALALSFLWPYTGAKVSMWIRGHG